MSLVPVLGGYGTMCVWHQVSIVPGGPGTGESGIRWVKLQVSLGGANLFSCHKQTSPQRRILTEHHRSRKKLKL